MKTRPAPEPVSNDYPRMLYRHPAVLSDAITLQDSTYDTEIADNEEEHSTLLGDGWHETPAKALAASPEPVKLQRRSARA